VDKTLKRGRKIKEQYDRLMAYNNI